MSTNVFSMSLCIIFNRKMKQRAAVVSAFFEEKEG